MPRPPWSAVTTEPAIAGEAAPLCHERQRHRRRLSFYIAAQQAAYRYPNKAASPRSSLPRALQNEGSISFRRCLHDTVSADPTDPPPEAPAPSHHFSLRKPQKTTKLESIRNPKAKVRPALRAGLFTNVLLEGFAPSKPRTRRSASLHLFPIIRG